MGQKKYKAVIFGNKLYREVSLPETINNAVCIGTTSKCVGAAKLDRQKFNNRDFEIAVFCGEDGQWTARCESGVEFVLNGSFHRKKILLSQWQEFEVFQIDSGKIIFKLSFELDFESEHKQFDYVINCAGLTSINIGRTSECHIMIEDNLIGDGKVMLTAANNGYDVMVSNIENGVYVNGYRITEDKFKVNDYDFLMIAGYSFYIKGCEFYTHYCDQIRVSRNIGATLLKSSYALEYPKFVLNTRIRHIVPKDEIEVLPPKEKEKPKQQGIITSLLPTLLTFTACLVMRSMMGSSGWYMMVMMGAGVLTSVITLVSDIRRRKKDEVKRQESYKKYIANKENDIVKARKKEIELLNKIYRPTSESVEALRDFNGELFDRNSDDDDFLTVVLGKGKLSSQQQIKSSKRESIDCDDDLMEIPDKVSKKYSKISNVPITVDLKKCNALGCVGASERNQNLLKQLTLDIALRQFYGDVKLFYIFNDEDIENFRWVRWLNHVRNASLDVRNIVCDKESKDSLFEFLYSELSARRQNRSNDQKFSEQYVVFVYDDMGIYNHPISKFIKSASEYGFTFIFFERYKERLPRGCDWVIMLESAVNKGKLINAKDSEDVSEFVYEPISDETANEVASLIAPVYVDEVSLESSLTKSITFYEMYNVYSADEFDFGKLWSRSDVTKSMAAPLGVRTGNEIVTLDLHEKYDGPHGLVAGTTGAGKSEIVQAYMLSMAVLFHPYEVGFIIIDWKGGGLSKQFENIPHNIGVLTSIDGENGINRFLASLSSERENRLRKFNRCGVNHIDAYIAKYKSGEVKEPMPHIILVVDEFAQLKKDYKEFIAEIVKIAATGRSIGIHLILATQDPGSCVDDEIKTNTNFALCLRTASANDSTKVIRSPLAYEIKKEERGRAYLQVGNNEKFFLFQSAYSSASIDSSAQNDSKQFVISELSTWGKRTVVFNKDGGKKKKSEKQDDRNKQIFAVISRIVEYCDVHGINQLSPICYPPLETEIKYSVGKKYFTQFTGNLSVAVGIYDDPSTQTQDAYYLNISAGNTLVIGSQASGKTNLVQYIIRSMSEQYTPEQVNFYIMDFSAGNSLSKMAEINTVGGFVNKGNDEGYKNLIKMLGAEIDRRQEIFNAVPGMCDSIKSYVEMGYTDLPMIVVVIENLTGLMEKNEGLANEMDESGSDLRYLLNSGISMGITFIVTNMSSTKIMLSYMNTFLNRIVFHCNDSSEYGNLLEKCHTQPKNSPGRALISHNNQVLNCQMFLAYDEDNVKDRQSSSGRIIRELNALYPDAHAKPIPSVPDLVTFDFIWNNYRFGKTKKYEIPIGIDYASIEPVSVDMNKVGSFFICGAPKSDQGNAMMLNIADELERRSKESPVEMYVIDTYERQLERLKNRSFTSNYTLNPEYIIELMTYIGTEVEKRQRMKVEGNMDLLEASPLIVVAIQNNDVIDVLSKSSKSLEVFRSIHKRSKAVKICFVFTDIENEKLPMSAPEVIKTLRDVRVGFSFVPLAGLKWIDVDSKEKRINRKPLSESDCFSFDGGNPIARIKTITQ